MSEKPDIRKSRHSSSSTDNENSKRHKSVQYPEIKKLKKSLKTQPNLLWSYLQKKEK